MAQEMRLKIAGLYTHPSDLSEVPEGALLQAKNLVIDEESIAEPRRGFDRYGYAIDATGTVRGEKIFSYEDKIIVHKSDDTLAYDSGSAFTDYSGTIAPPDSATKMQAVKANGNFYFTTSKGIWKLDSSTGTPVAAGVDKGLTIEVEDTGSSGIYTTSDQAAYRVVWGYKDANNNLILGAPSERREYTAPSAGDAEIEITIPANATTSWLYQIYRTDIAAASPGDEMQLIYESNPTSNQINGTSFTFVDGDVSVANDTVTETAHGFSTADEVTLSTTGTLPAGLATSTTYYIIVVDADTFKFASTVDNANAGTAVNITGAAGGGTHTVTMAAGLIHILDNVPDSIKGATLYTSPSQETIANQNTTPPFAKDIALFKNRLWALNTKSRHSQRVTLIAVPANDDTITVDGTVYTFKTTATASTHIPLVTSGTVAQNIADTAQNMCKTINQYSSNTTINAFYISGVDDTPGICLFEKRDVSASSFTTTTSTTTNWQPQELSSGVTSTNDNYANGLVFSKNQEYEAFPSKNLFRIGSQSDEGNRILPLRDSLFVLTEGGVYRVTGEDEGSFRVDLFDNTVKIIGIETAVTLNNAIYFLSDQGVVQLTETGATVISRPIESELLELVGTIKTTVESYAFAVGYESERKYILGMPQASTDTAATVYYVYNTFTRAWTRWEDMDALTAAINPTDDKLYLVDDSSNYLLEERKSYDFSDYVDYSKTITITDVSGDGLTLTVSSGNASGVSAGDVIYQADDTFSVVASTDTDTDTITVEFDGGLTAAGATVLSAINSVIEWVPFTGGNPGLLKHFYDVALIFRENFRIEATIGFTSDQSLAVESVTYEAQGLGHWGFFNWGEIPWGGDLNKEPVRTYPPLEKARATQLNVRFTHSIGYSNFKLNGCSVHFNEVSERFRR